MKLRTKLFLPLIGFSIFFGIYAHFVWFNKYISTFIENHENDIQAHLKTAAEGLVPLLLEDRLATVYGNLDALLKQNPSWMILTLYDADGKLLYPIEPVNIPANSKTVQVYHQPVTFSQPPIASLTLAIDLTDFYKTVANMEKDFHAALAILLLTIILSVVTIIEIVVSRPIRAMSYVSRQIAKGDFDGNLPINSTGEIGDLVKNFVNMRDSILAYHTKLKGEIDNHKETAKALYEQKELASFQASHDALTGLINRREFERRVNAAIECSFQDGSHHILLYVDLDQFKIVNDTCGHIAGDMLLRQLSEILKEKTRQEDTLARLGGDEFGLLFEYCKLKDGLEIAQNLLEVIKEFRFSWNSKLFNIGASIGVVEFSAQSGNYFDILSAADSACYSAKDDGRNRIKIYKNEDVELNRRKGEMLWTTRLLQALENDHLMLYCQPITPLNSNITYGTKHCEILVRLKDEEGEIIYPDSFIMAAERYNLISAIDRWVIKHTFLFMQQYKALNNNNFDLKLSVNLSGVSLGDKETLEFIEEQFKKYAPVPGAIGIEITETAAIQNLSQAVMFMKCLKKYGCQFSLDDFGSGLSSFYYLKSLPVDFVKIDGGFVCDMENDPLDTALVKSINEIGHVMGKKTIAEFVSNRNIANMCKDIGIDFAQGYYFSKPFPIERLLPARMSEISKASGLHQSEEIAEVS